MNKKINTGDLLGNKKDKTIETKNLIIQGQLLKWDSAIIQISNISLITSANMNPPGFPLWAAVVAIGGLFIIGIVWYLGLLALAIGGFAIYSWYSDVQRTKNQKYLNILLNSGQTYSVLFYDKSFLDKVLQVFANIFEDGGNTGVYYYIDINNSTISNGSSVVSTTER